MGRNKNGKWGFLRHLSIFQGVKIKTFKKKYIFSCHDEDNDKSSREKIVLDFSSKFNRSISAQCITKTIAKRVKFLEQFELWFKPEDAFSWKIQYYEKSPIPGILNPMGFSPKNLRFRCRKIPEIPSS